MSLAASWPKVDKQHKWRTAGGYAVSIGQRILAEGLPRLTLLNVNVPNLAPGDVKGTRWVRQGRKSYRDRVERRTDPRGGMYFWLWGVFDPAEIVEGTDLAAVRDGYVSITPLSIDRTNHEELGRRWRDENAPVGSA